MVTHQSFFAGAHPQRPHGSEPEAEDVDSLERAAQTIRPSWAEAPVVRTSAPAPAATPAAVQQPPAPFAPPAPLPREFRAGSATNPMRAAAPGYPAPAAHLDLEELSPPRGLRSSSRPLLLAAGALAAALTAFLGIRAARSPSAEPAAVQPVVQAAPPEQPLPTAAPSAAPAPVVAAPEPTLAPRTEPQPAVSASQTSAVEHDSSGAQPSRSVAVSNKKRARAARPTVAPKPVAKAAAKPAAAAKPTAARPVAPAAPEKPRKGVGFVSTNPY